MKLEKCGTEVRCRPRYGGSLAAEDLPMVLSKLKIGNSAKPSQSFQIVRFSFFFRNLLS
jgi:hypothetical protein